MAETTRRRLNLLVLVLGALALILVARLFLVQAVEGADYQQRGVEERTHDLRLPDPPRGCIRDRNGVLLAGNDVRYAIEVSPSYIPNVAGAVPQLADILALPPDVISATLTGGRSWVTLEQDATREQGQAIEDLFISGIDTRLWWARIYPQGELTAHFLGFVSQSGDGFYGVEGFYDADLRPQASQWHGETDPLVQDPLPFLEGDVETPLAGVDLELTLDLGIQMAAQQELARGLEEFGAQKGLVIVMDPRSGAILAMVSIPSYDPHQYIDYLNQDALFVNPAIGFQYEPGSVFKVVTMAAALDSGTVTPETTYYDEGAIEIGGLVTRNWDRQAYGVQDMRGLMANSLNVGAAWLSQRMGAETFYRYVRTFGFDNPTGIDLQGEASGSVHEVGQSDWHDSELGTNSYGQGLAVTPIQMIAAVGAVANGGQLMTPYLVERQVLPDGSVLTHQPVVRGHPISAQTAQALTEILAYVVDENVPLAQVPGYHVAGKTGTAQIPLPGGYDPDGTIASFVGFAPAENPEVIILVRLDRPSASPWGSQTATVIFRRLAERVFPMLDIPPSDVQ
ncbi:MAG: penicillin-binding protein 2 [Anaerolineae bacterium]|nr:penicillin-binding protein 2 [Anaerolineae bacterium]